MTFFNVNELDKTEALKGIYRRAVYLDGLMLTFFEFSPDSTVPEHEHPHEQITLVLEGELEFTLDGRTKIITKGEGVTIPSNVPHGARSLSLATKVLDAWHPIREDYR